LLDLSVFLFPLQRISVSLPFFFYPRYPIGIKKYLYPCPLHCCTQIGFQVFLKQPGNE
jgi:hypothetical protein